MTDSPIDPNLRYQTLRELGMSRPNAAVIANSRPAPTANPEDENLAHWNRDELERHAAEIGIDQPGRLGRAALIRALRHRASPTAASHRTQ